MTLTLLNSFKNPFMKGLENFQITSLSFLGFASFMKFFNNIKLASAWKRETGADTLSFCLHLLIYTQPLRPPYLETPNLKITGINLCFLLSVSNHTTQFM